MCPWEPFFVLIVKNGIQRDWQKEVFDLAHQKIVCLREGSPPIELAVREIQVLGESRIGLFVQGGNPLKAFVIPRAIRDFEKLKQELNAYCKVTPIRSQKTLLAVLPLALAIGTSVFLLMSKSCVVVLIAGVVALLFHASWLIAMRKIWPRTRSPKGVMLAFPGFLVCSRMNCVSDFQRASSTLHS